MSALKAIQQPGKVIGAKGMQKTVKVQLTKQVWNKGLRKNFNVPYKILVHDPNGSVNEGDVITMVPELHSRRVRHAVSSIVSAFGTPLSERPPILSEAERQAIYQEKRVAKLQRRATRGIGSAIRQLEDLGISPPSHDHPVVGEGAGIAEDGKVVEHGREVLPGGLHKFGKIQDEAPTKKRSAEKRFETALEQELNRQQIAEEPIEPLAKESLRKKPGAPS